MTTVPLPVESPADEPMPVAGSRPFVIFALPRSRTAWLAAFLSYGRHRCGHDLATDCSSVAEFRKTVKAGYGGTVETGAVAGWRAIRHVCPDFKAIVVRRPVQDVLSSLARAGLSSAGIEAEITQRSAMLDHLSAQSGVATVTFEQLSDPAVCAALWRECHGSEMDFAWWKYMAARNVQIDLAVRMQKLRRNRLKTEALKSDAIECLPDMLIEPEPFVSMWPEMEALGRLHFEEVDGGVEPRRPYRPNAPLMQAMEQVGCLKITTARAKGKLIGYCMWNVSPDAESEGLMIARHGPWYMLPEHKGVGTKLFKRSVAELRAMGIHIIYPHHRMQGRGQRLGMFYRRIGAIEVQREYSLWIGD